MAEAKHKDLILETIDSLRKRKARPDLERICHMVERRHNITFEETEADLEKLVDCGIVIKVDYKGSTSYRNAAKWRKSHLGGAGFNSHDAIRRLHSVVGSLLADPLLPPTQAGGGSGTSSTPTTTDPATTGRRADQGVPAADIERRLLEEEDTAHLTTAVIQTALNKEVEAGRLKLLPSGNYIVGDAKLPERGSGKLSPGGGAGAEGGGARHPSGGSGGSPTKKGRPAGVKRKIKQCTKSPKEPKPKRPCSTEDALHSGNEGAGGGTGTGDTTPETRDDDDGDDQTPSGGPGADFSDAEKEMRLALPSSSSSGSGGTGTGQSGAGRSSSGSSSVVQTPKVSMAVLTADGLTFLDSEYKCDYCLLTSECNRVGRPEDLLYCKDCQAKAHPSCMDYSEDLARRARNSPWQCIDCKTCYVCEDSGDPDAMLFCDACDKGYHMNCHNPQVLDKPTGKWVCSKCVLELGIGNGETLDQGEGNESELRQGNGPSSNNNNTSSVNKNTEGGGASCLPTPSDSPVYFNELQDTKDDRSTASSNDHREHRPSLTLKISNRHMMPSLPRLSDTLPAVVPDASEWTIDDVVQFFRNVGFVDQAEVFREQEIDGRSLLLMRRSDVLTGLSLKLGPALKIYTHVQRLQMRCDSAL